MRPVEFIGMIGTSNASETRAAPAGPGVVDKAFVAATARGHEYAGFDRVLIGYFSVAADGFQVAAFAAHATERLGLLLAHRPGFVAPTLAARQLASLDQFSDGRLAVHVITGGSDDDQARDGDFLEKAERYARTDEYLDVVRQAWTSPSAFDHDGVYYRVRGGTSTVRCLQTPHIPVYFGGSSDEAIEVAGKHADVYALWGESLAAVAETIGRVRAAAARHGRADHIRFSLSLRPILGRTEDEAWARAGRILDQAKALRGAMTRSEVLLWVRLRARTNREPNFRRQHPIGPYITDFCCSTARLVIEVDGGVHEDDERQLRDARRDAYMNERGYRVLRIDARAVFNDPDKVAADIRALALAPPPSRSA